MDNNKRCEERAKKLEYKYVHDVYSSQALSYNGLCDGPWPEIKSFLFSLLPGSFVADVGCGNGKYLTVRNDIVVHGVDICQELSCLAYERHRNISIANNLSLPYRSSTMDAVISVGVLHHFASFERRLQSVKELARILKPGGQILIYVWAWEQKQRKFRSQDVLIPWMANHEKTEYINGFSNHHIEPKNMNMRGTCFQENGCLKQHSVTHGYEDSRKFKEKSLVSNETVNFDLLPSARDSSSIDVDDGDQLPPNEEQLSDSSLISSINNFTAEVRGKLQRFSFWKRRKNISDGGVDFDGLNTPVCYNSHNIAANSKQIDKTEQYKMSICDNGNSTCYSKRINDAKSCNENNEGFRSQSETFQRFYHVFLKDELSELVQGVRGLKIITQHYDHGNWVVRAEKRVEPK